MSEPTPPRYEGNDDVSSAVPPPPPPPPLPPTPEWTDARADAQPTQAYAAPADDQPTLAYPNAAQRDADEQPTLAYAPAAYPAAQQYDGGTGYGGTRPTYAGSQPVPPPYAGSSGVPGPTDGRPRALAIAAIAAAAVGLLLTLGGFVPVAGLATVLAVIGGLLLLVALVLAIIVLASKSQGGKPLGVVALIVSVLGGILFAIAFVASLFWVGLAAAGRETVDVPAAPDSSASALPSEEASAPPSESATPEASGTYDEAAYLAAVRPEIVSIVQEIQPDFTADQLNEIYSDQVLISIGQSFAAVDSVSDGSRQITIDTLVSSSGGLLTQDQATRLYDTIANAAQQYLRE